MASTLQSRVESYTGAVTGITDSASLDNFLTAALNEIADAIPENRMRKYGTLVTANSNPIAQNIIRLLAGFYGDRPASIGSQNNIFNYVDPDSIMFATSHNPITVQQDDEVNVYPVPDSNTAGKALVIQRSTITRSLTTIPNWPNETDDLIVVGASIRVLENVLKTLQESTPAEPIAPTVLSLTTTAGLDLPSFLPIPAEFSLTATAPSTPTYKAWPSLTPPSVPTYASWPALTPPVYSPSWTLWETDMTADDIEQAQERRGRIATEIADYAQNIQKYGAEIQEAAQEILRDNDRILGQYSADIQKYGAQIQEAAQEILRDNERVLGQYSADIQKYISQVQAEVAEYSQNLDRFLRNNQDIIAIYRTQLDRYQAEIISYQSELQKINLEVQTAGSRIKVLKDSWVTQTETILGVNVA